MHNIIYVAYQKKLSISIQSMKNFDRRGNRKPKAHKALKPQAHKFKFVQLWLSYVVYA